MLQYWRCLAGRGYLKEIFPMKKLYMFYLGGNAGRSNIEVHDVQFAVCSHFEEAVPALKESWFGDKDKVHIDGYQIIDWADGFDVYVSETPPSGDDKLYFVNVGGYTPASLAEAHEFGLFVAKNAGEAKQKAMDTLLRDHALLHKDNLKDIDNYLLLQEVGGWHIGLRPNLEGSAPLPSYLGYHPI